jgi:uncharacterized protein involved in exopolysaccharide biosynthesis
MADTSPQTTSGTRPGFGSTRDLISLLFRRKAIALAIFSLIFLASAMSLARQKTAYVADTRILVLRGEGGAQGPIPRPTLQWWEEMKSEVEILRSRPVAERAAATLGRQATATGLAPQSEVVAASAPSADDLLGNLTAEPIEETNFIRLAYHALDPRSAIDGVNAIAEAYLAHRRSMRSNKQTAEFFEEQILTARSAVERMRAELALYKTQNGLTDIDKQTSELIHQRAIIEGDLTVASGKRAALEAEVEVIEESLRRHPDLLVPTPELAEDDNLRDYQRRLAEIDSKYNSLLARYTAESPQVQAVVRDREACVTSIRAVVDGLVNAKRNQLAVLRGQENALRAQHAAILAKLGGLPEHEAKVALMMLELKTATDELQALEAQHQQHRLQEATDPRLSNLQILAPAVTAKRVGGGMKQKLFMVFSFILAAGMALVAAFMVDTLDHTIRFPADVEAALGVPVLGSVRDVRPVRTRT